jgi:hypothetical protein
MKETIHIKDIFPKDWFDENGKSNIYVSSYYCFTDVLERKQEWYLAGRILNATFLIIDTVLEYHTTEIFFKGIVNFIPQFESNLQNKKTEKSAILFLFLQYDLESKTLGELQSARGLLSNIEGKNSNYLHITDYIHHFPEGNKSLNSPSIKMPDPCPAFLTEIMVESISEKINSLELELQSRIKLALRWVDSSEHETNGIDEFLKLWFAIETISMPDSTDIKPLVIRLAKIYKLEPQEAKEYFGVGRILGLRSNIVHNGHITGIHQQLIDYLKAIFNDTLLDICCLPNNKRTKQILEDSTFNKVDWLP